MVANMAMYNMAVLKGQYNKALECLDKCIAALGSDSLPTQMVSLASRKAAVLQLAYTRTSDNDYLARAIAAYESLLSKLPNNHPAYSMVLNNLSYMLAENDERLPEALAFAEKANVLSPSNAGLMDTYAYVLYKSGRFKQAEQVLHSALQLYERNGTSVPAEVYEHLGMIKEELGAREQALDAYQQALQSAGGQLSDKVIERIRKAVERLSAASVEK